MLFSLLLLVLIIVFTRIAFIFSNKKKHKVVKFVGPRGTGKTKTICELMGFTNKTVPTLESYSVTYKGIVIHDVIEKTGSFLEKYGIDDPLALYFFFIKTLEDLPVIPKGFDLKFVYYRSLKEGDLLRKDIIFLNEDSTQMNKYLFQ